MKYEKDRGNSYKVVGTFPLDDFEQIERGAGISISTNQLEGQAPCPYCGDPLWAMCNCQKVHCCPSYHGSIDLTCPWCGKRDTYSECNFSLGGGGG